MKTMKLAACIAAFAFVLGCASSAPSAGGSGGASSGGAARAPQGAGDELDNAIREISDYLNKRVPAGNKAVFLNVKSDWPDLSEYILSGLMENAVNDEVFSVVDRQQIDAIRSELNFQWSGEVSDSSAQEIGQMLGAQTIVSGAVTTVGSVYRIQARAIAVQTAAVQGQFSQNVNGKGETIAALTAKKAPASPAPASTGAKPPATAPAAPAAAKLANGTYTFYPRLRAIQGGRDVNAYIDRIVVRGEYMNIFLTNVPVGKGGNPAGEWQHSWRISANEFFIQDLDRPTRTWVKVNHGDDEVTGGMFFTFQGVTASRFSLTSRSDNPIMVFDEIILKNPD